MAKTKKPDYHISVYLDTRRKKKTGKFPVKLRVYTHRPRKQKLYTTVYEFTDKEFEKIWLADKPQGRNKVIKQELEEIEVKAREIAEKIKPFSFDEFERRLGYSSGQPSKLKYHYDIACSKLLKHNQLGTYSVYQTAIKSFDKFSGDFDNLTLHQITPDWLERYESYMTGSGRSVTTISMYLRTLRTVFNNAIKTKDIDRGYYPFGEGKYEIPSKRNVKKALKRPELKTLFEAEPSTPEQEKAKDFWFLSFACNGLNIKDIALLRNKDFYDDMIIIYRAKIKRTKKKEQTPIKIYLNNLSRQIIEKYRTGTNPDEFVFDILSDDMTEDEKHRKIKAFTRFVNQHIKKLAKSVGLSEAISTYWARHTYATIAVNDGATMEQVQQNLGHSNVKTTQTYFEGFEDETMRKLSENVIKFD